MATDKTHVIRLDLDGTAPRWVKRIGRTDEHICTVSFDRSQARLMAHATALRHAERLQAAAKRLAVSVEEAKP